LGNTKAGITEMHNHFPFIHSFVGTLSTLGLDLKECLKNLDILVVLGESARDIKTFMLDYKHD
jgi:hypothetical protein